MACSPRRDRGVKGGAPPAATSLHRIVLVAERAGSLRRLLVGRRPPLPGPVARAARQWLVDTFHTHYYYQGGWRESTWLGVPVLQCPGDLLVLQQIMWETRPDVILETGTFYGGSTLFFATIFDLIGAGSVVSVDIDQSHVNASVRDHPRVTLLRGDSTAPETRASVLPHLEGRRAMLFLDADHRREAVLAELHAYADFVPEGCYAVVADSNIDGHPVRFVDTQPYRGPWDAIHEFLRGRDDFEVDASRHLHLVTFHPDGYLRRRVPS